jgi:flagellar motor switch protein FliM
MNKKKRPAPLQQKRPTRLSAVIKAGGHRLGTEDRVEIEDYTLGDSREVSIAVLEALKERHQKMCLTLESRLSMFLRSEVRLELEGLFAAKYRKVAGEIDEDFHLSLFRADAATGAGFFGCSTAVALAAVNLLLGGGAGGPKEVKSLTKIEADLFAEVAREVLEGWRDAWRAEMEFNPQVFQQANSVKNFTQCDGLTAVLHAKVRFEIGETEGRACLVYPVHMIESVVRGIEESAASGAEAAAGGRVSAGQWSAVYRNVPVRPDVRIDAGQITVREFLALEAGAVIPLQNQAMESARMSLAGTQLFRGSYGVDGGRLALSLTHKLNDL